MIDVVGEDGVFVRRSATRWFSRRGSEGSACSDDRRSREVEGAAHDGSRALHKPTSRRAGGGRDEKFLEPKAVPHFTPAERVARGKAARAEVPRSSHAEWEPPSNRRDPVDLLEEQAETRVPELVPIRYGRMLVSPFTFFRGGAYLMAADLADMPRTGLHAQLCGDAHLSNFGSFAAPDRSLVFSVNDFDETLPGPFEWDVKRLAASFEVAGRDRGFDEAIAPRGGADDRARLPRGDGELRGDAQHRPLVRAPRRRRDA